MADTDKQEKNKKAFNWRNLLYGLLIGLLVGITAILIGFLEISDHLELMTLDLRYRLRPPIEVLPEVGYIEFDDASLELFGKWPWPRSRQMALVKTLGFYNARAAGYDVFFIEKENIVFHPELLDDFLKDGVTKNRSEFPMLLNESFRDYDREFADAIRNAGNIYLAYFSHDPRSSLKGLAGIIRETEENRKQFSDLKKKSISELEKTFLKTKDALVPSMYKTSDLDAPLSDLILAGRGIGFAQPGYNTDSIVRNYIFFRYYNGHTLYPITARMLSDIMDFKIPEIEASPGRQVVLKNARDYKTGERKDIKISIDNNLQSLLNWAGPFDKTFLHIPFALLNYYYSYNTAKEIARKHSVKGVDEGAMAIVSKRIRSRLIAEEAASHDEALKISQEIAAAQLVTRLLERGLQENDVRKKIKKHLSDNQTEQVLHSVLAGKRIEKALLDNRSVTFEQFMEKEKDFIRSDTASAADNSHLQEMFRNIKWFAGKGRIEDSQPYYFPPARSVSSNGRQILFSPVDLENKIFMIGLTGAHTIDLKPTPFEESAPMVAYHVNALNTILTKQFLSYPPEYYKYTATILLALIIGVIGSVFSIPVSFGLTAFVAGGYLYATYKIWEMKGQWLHWATPVEGIVLTYLTIIVVQFVKALREKKKVRGIFSAMVSPAVLKVMEENPDKFSLTGERKPATTLFSKIDGIGPVIKAVAPDELTNLLSIYLTPNSEIIMDYDGYIDKYEGHVIMADFGVPLDDADNPWKCVFSTIEQRLDIEAFKYFVLAKYGQNVGVSMGFNYGYVSAGNMGSERKFQYTVMGDSVNVSARFMAANFIYNSVNAITGEDTLKVIEDYVYLRPLDRLLLKGKTKPIDIYDVVGWKPDAYLKLRGERPVPDYLNTLWSMCPPEKIFGYYRFWSAKYARTGHPLAKNIQEFFGNSLDTARVLMANEWKREMVLYHERVEMLKANAHSLMGWSSGSAGSSDKMEFHDILNKWALDLRDIVDTLKGKIKQTAGDEVNADSMSDKFEGMLREGAILLNKAELLRSRLERKQASSFAKTAALLDERIEVVLEEIRKFVPIVYSAPSGGDIQAGQLLQIIGEDRRRYANNVGEFFKSLKGKKKEYHEMMSVIGAPDADSLELLRCFEEGLQLYWQRDWDAALVKFRQAMELAPDEGPVTSFIERIETYKTNPPGKEWQGEFVQTKK